IDALEAQDRRDDAANQIYLAPGDFINRGSALRACFVSVHSAFLTARLSENSHSRLFSLALCAISRAYFFCGVEKNRQQLAGVSLGVSARRRAGLLTIITPSYQMLVL